MGAVEFIIFLIADFHSWFPGTVLQIMQYIVILHFVPNARIYWIHEIHFGICIVLSSVEMVTRDLIFFLDSHTDKRKFSVMLIALLSAQQLNYKTIIYSEWKCFTRCQKCSNTWQDNSLVLSPESNLTDVPSLNFEFSEYWHK